MAEINKPLTTYHLSTGEERAYQPAKRNFFVFVVEDLGTLLKPGVDAELAQDTDYITNGQEILTLMVAQANVPHFQLNNIDLRRGNSVVHYAGVPTFSDGQIMIDDMIGAQSKAVIEAWQNLAYDVMTDKGGRAINYKRNCTLIEYTSDHVKVRSWKLIGCWVSNIDEPEFNRESDDLKQLTCTIIYDRAIPEIEEV